MTKSEIGSPREQAIARLTLAEGYWQKVLVDENVPVEVKDAIYTWRERTLAELIEAEIVDQLADRALHPQAYEQDEKSS